MQVNHVEILLSEFDASLKLLAKNHHVRIDKMSPELRESYLRVKHTVTTFHGSPAYAIVKQTIAKLVKPSKLEPETLGSYIWGCVQECYGDVNKYCTPLCINSIPSETDESPSCNHHIITREIDEDGKVDLVCLNCNKNSDDTIHTAILYSNEDIDALTGQEIRFIKNLGISQLAIMIKDGYKYQRKLEMTPIDRIETRAPASMIPKGFIQSPMNIVEEHHEEQSTNNYWVWFLIIILIVIFAFMVYFFL